MKKGLIIAAAMILAVCLGIGGTLAYLYTQTSDVVNTFTVGDIGIELTETANQDDDTWSAQMIPGKVYSKNPVVKVLRSETNVDIYLFVKFQELNNAKTYLDYTSTLTTANGWTELEAGVWYREVKASDSTIEWHLLEGDKVTINSTNVKKDTFDSVAAENLPKLVYTAYAIQKDGFTPAAAWAEVSK